MHEDRLVSAGGTEFRIFIDGRADKPWLTCLHSLGTHSGVWDKQIREFEQDFRILRIDARGHGESAPVAGPYSFDLLVNDVVSVWNVLGIENSAVLGLSLGGMTALGLALDHAHRVTKIVAADCRSDAPEVFRMLWEQRQTMLNREGIEAIANATLPAWLTEETRRTRPDQAARVRSMILKVSREGYLGATEALRSLDYKKRLSDISCPACLVAGEMDIPHPEEMRSMAALIPLGQFREVPQAGHLSNFENPTDFNRLVLEFLLAN